MEALRFGVTASEFWDMTPRETIAALEAAAWRMRQEQSQMLNMAWHTAALTRARKLPALATLLNRMKGPDKTPLAERRKEFEEMKARMGKATEDGGRRTKRG